MKLFLLLATAVIGFTSHAQVQSQENFLSIMSKIQDSDSCLTG